MKKNSLEKFEKICIHIIRNIPSTYTWKWKWDDEFFTALVVFEEDDSGSIFSILTDEFDHHCDYFSFETSPDNIKNTFNNVLGLIPGQNLFTSELESGLVLYAAWWPWGNDDKISLRIGIVTQDEDDLIKEKIKSHLLQWFAI